MANTLDILKTELFSPAKGEYRPDWFRAQGYINGTHTSPSERRADGIYALFTLPEPYIYKGDLIAGSVRPLFVSLTPEQIETYTKACQPYPERNFFSHSDHFAPDYETILTIGIPGLLEKIATSRKAHEAETEAVELLDSMALALEGLTGRLRAYADKASKLAKENAAEKAEGIDQNGSYDAERLRFIEENCRALTEKAPETFAQGLQLVWMIHSCFVYEGRYAMALGRIDQYLYPLYKKDIDRGLITPEFATELLANTFLKICETRIRGGDDVVNICIGGIDRTGNLAVNPLSYCVLHAVRDVNLPGPNLSARITSDTPDEFLDDCLKVIGTGLGYPALMNDNVNIAALRRYGYDEEDIRNYCMVGCIENFLPGLQPPWADGRFDPINYLEILLRSDAEGISSGTDLPATMDEFMSRYMKLLEGAVKDYVDRANALMHVADPKNLNSPFLSCFCNYCIERGKDINNGGSKYPSIHGAALMGVGTVSDSLAAIEKLVYIDKYVTLPELSAALKDNFDGHGELLAAAKAAPKYGNNDQFVDKYAVWYTDYISGLFRQYHTYDGGGFYTAMAANISNIHAGMNLGATPDGRLAGKPLSDAASPTYGCDTRGVTLTLQSVSKPDYTNCACGTVVNQKFSPSAFKDGKREKLLKLIRVYFERGGQEIQINSTSREVLEDAMIHPENNQSLVVRVSGFSALYVTLAREVQEDILSRTQHEDL